MIDGKFYLLLGNFSIGIDIFILLGKDLMILVSMLVGLFLLPILQFLDERLLTISILRSSALF
jgi:hypothetical protein